MRPVFFIYPLLYFQWEQERVCIAIMLWSFTKLIRSHLVREELFEILEQLLDEHSDIQ